MVLPKAATEISEKGLPCSLGIGMYGYGAAPGCNVQPGGMHTVRVLVGYAGYR